MVRHDPRDGHLAEHHADAADDEQRPAAGAVHDGGGQQRGGEVGHAVDHGAEDGLLAVEPHRAEQHGREDGDDDHAGELVEHRYAEPHRQAVPVPPAEQPPERAGLVLARLVHGADDVLELGVNVGAGAADALQRRAGAVVVAAQDEAAGRVRDEERPRDDDGARDGREAERDAPPPPRDAVGEVVGDGRRQYPDHDEGVVRRRERAAPPRRRRLRQIHRS
ncbi:Os04g0453233 [Oryza sativa Japonica Group]|uniref:Os04g0453233 protein n=1 Tax=Oryza sativa subsp. japonica TaxID=39947 RepID=A0A0P0WAW7_ORYSJ|nr:hypothetical protein EE612_023673 [Oryza sativa]BAS89482.1 Os04g0453233 [Oryza sativa Japonica Group]